MPQLNEKLLQGNFKLPKSVQLGSREPYRERILQIGEGVFLRAFADWMINETNRQGLLGSKVVVASPIPGAVIEKLNRQNGLYTVHLRGLQKKESVERTDLVTCISRGIDPKTQWQDFLACAANPDLRIMISNTTEVGIADVSEPNGPDVCPISFPGKVTAFLYERFRRFNGAADKGLIIIPCELIERNGDKLKALVLRRSGAWNLGQNFSEWLRSSNHFLCSLVDRIVTGYPQDEIAELTKKLHYTDELMDTAETYHLWAIEGSAELAEEFPLHKAGCNVIWTDDLEPYRLRKVRILNGAHTLTTLPAYLCGKNNVLEFMQDPTLHTYITKGIFEEILPTLDVPEARQFAEDVIDRFSNPHIHHLLLNISVNSISKFKVRLLPSLIEYRYRKQVLPRILTFSLASLIAFYRGTEIENGALLGHRDGEPYLVRDERKFLEIIAAAWRQYDKCQEIDCLLNRILGQEIFWGQDLEQIPGFTATVGKHLEAILGKGMAAAVKEVVG
jgi:tagaturonate reductase